MEAGLPVDFHTHQTDFDSTSKIVGDGRYEKEACIHVALGLLSGMPVMLLFRSSRNNMEINRERPFLALIYFTLLCSLIRTAQHIYYLLFTGEVISINKCTIMAHTYYVAEVLPQQIAMIILINSFFETSRGRSFDFRNLFKWAGLVIFLAIALNTTQYIIGTPSPNFPLCLPYNINFELNDIYHHLGYCILFTNVGLSAYLCFGITHISDAHTQREVQNAVCLTLFIYSSCCLGVIFPLSIYTHVHEFPLWVLALSVNAFEFFHSFSAGFLSIVFILRLPYLRSSILESVVILRNRFN